MTSVIFKSDEWTRYLPVIYNDHSFADVTLVCEGKQVLVHRSILASISPFFRDLLANFETSLAPIILLEGFRYKILKLLINFFYNGMAEGTSEDILALTKDAKELNVIGLTNSGHSDKPLLKLELLQKKKKIHEQLQKLQSKNDSDSESSSSEEDFLEIVYERKTGTTQYEEKSKTEKPIQNSLSKSSSGNKRAFPSENPPSRLTGKKIKPSSQTKTPGGTGELPCSSQTGGLKPKKCSICKEMFSDRVYWRAHLEFTHSELLTCSICDKIFTTQNNLKKHLNNHISKVDGQLSQQQSTIDGSLFSIDEIDTRKNLV